MIIKTVRDQASSALDQKFSPAFFNNKYLKKTLINLIQDQALAALESGSPRRFNQRNLSFVVKIHREFGWFGSPFSSDIWNPFDYGGDRLGDETSALAHAHVDWRETDKAHIFRVDLPGVGKKEVKVQVEDGNILQISGERTEEHEDVTHKWHRVERRRGGFLRRFRLPEDVNLDKIKCGLEDGVLTVTLPKKETEEPPRNVRYIDVE